MGQKSRTVSSSPSLGSLERRKKDKTVQLLDGLVADLARRTQAAIEGTGPSGHLESIRAIQRLLLQIQKLERPLISQQNVADVSTRLKLLEDWLNQQGVELEGIELKGGLPEGAGVVAKKSFEKRQMLCTVPAHAMMTTATAIRSKDDVGLIFKADPILRQMPTLILALHLLFEKHRPSEDPSNWAGYIASLPCQGILSDANSDVSASDNFVMPLAFSLDTVEALRGTAVLVEMHKALRNYARQYAHVRLVLKQLRGHSQAIENANTWFTWTEFRWAASIVMTRQNPIPGTPDMEMGQALALIPLLDLFNHEEGDITCHFSVTHQQMELTAKRQFEAGEQVYISYGYRPNSVLLLYSGFVPDHNSKDRIKVPVELSQSDPLYAKKVALLKWLELPASGWLELFHDGTPSPELATWIKVAAMNEPSVLTKNLRAAIASRAQETAAMLQYKAALKEAEEKARHGELQQLEVELTDKVIHTAEENGSNEEQDFSAENATSNGSTHEPEKQDRILEEKKVLLNEGASELTDELKMNSSESFENPVEASKILKVDETENTSGMEVTLQDSFLGELLFPVEAGLLAEICLSRLAEFGSDMDVEVNGHGEEFPLGLGIRLVSPKLLQPKGVTKELSMALKVRHQEQCALQRAIDRASVVHHSHSHECQHC